mmetsp:Transcript_14574/g.43077  ORF Transcript_14574/g.43077 Transcript_14574/m.43077 type:complete len:206 (+) Transcript_14574:465-1082(+)
MARRASVAGPDARGGPRTRCVPLLRRHQRVRQGPPVGAGRALAEPNVGCRSAAGLRVLQWRYFSLCARRTLGTGPGPAERDADEGPPAQHDLVLGCNQRLLQGWVLGARPAAPAGDARRRSLAQRHFLLGGDQRLRQGRAVGTRTHAPRRDDQERLDCRRRELQRSHQRVRQGQAVVQRPVPHAADAPRGPFSECDHVQRGDRGL